MDILSPTPVGRIGLFPKAPWQWAGGSTGRLLGRTGLFAKAPKVLHVPNERGRNGQEGARWKDGGGRILFV